MKFADGHEGMYVEVTEKYRSIFERGNLQSMITGNGFGKIVGFRKIVDWENTEHIFKLKWSNGYTSSMAPTHLQPSTKKAFFIAALQG